MGRAPCCEKKGLNRGPWTPEEDLLLTRYIQTHAPGNWRALAKNAGLKRCGKSCRLRWTNYLRPDIKRGRFSSDEEDAIIQLHSVMGNKWSAIAARLPGRTDNEIKNYWNTHIRKKLLQMGVDPVTHAPRLDLFDFSSFDLNTLSNFLMLINPEFQLMNIQQQQNRIQNLNLQLQIPEAGQFNDSFHIPTPSQDISVEDYFCQEQQNNIQSGNPNFMSSYLLNDSSGTGTEFDEMRGSFCMDDLESFEVPESFEINGFM